MTASPQFDPKKADQIAALPLGGPRQSRSLDQSSGIDQDEASGAQLSG